MNLSSFKPLILVFTLYLAGLGAAAQFAKIAVPFSYYQARYPDAGSELGWLLTLVSALGAVLGMTAGVWVARIGSKKALVFALLLGAGVSFVQAMLPSLAFMMVSRVVEGASHLLMVVAAPTLIAQVSNDRFRPAAMTLWSTFFSVTFALVAWLGLPFVAQYGLANLLMGHGIYMLTIALLLALMLAPAVPIAVHGPSGLARIMDQHIKAYRSPFLIAPAVGWLFYTLTFVSLITVLPGLLAEDSRVLVTSLMPLASIAASLVLVLLLLAVFSTISVIIIGFLCSCLVIGAYFLGLPLAITCVALFAMLGLVQGASFAAVPVLNHTQQDRALANGAMAQMGNIGNLLGTPLMLMILGVADVSGMLGAVVALFLLASLAHMGMARWRAVKPLENPPQ